MLPSETFLKDAGLSPAGPHDRRRGIADDEDVEAGDGHRLGEEDDGQERPKDEIAGPDEAVFLMLPEEVGGDDPVKELFESLVEVSEDVTKDI